MRNNRGIGIAKGFEQSDLLAHQGDAAWKILGVSGRLRWSLGRAAVKAPAAHTWVLAHTRVPVAGTIAHVCVIPDDPEAYARALYGELHRCDDASAELIVVEAPPEGPAWAAVAERRLPKRSNTVTW